MKKVLLIVFIFSVIMIMVGCENKEINQQELIFNYVEINENKLRKIVDDICSMDEIKELEYINNEVIIEQIPQEIKVKNVYKLNNNCINFAVNEGFVSNSHYYGFYYSASDVPLSAGTEDNRLKEYGNGYRIQEEENEDWYYTEKIVDNFYFYEEHY